MEYELLDTGVFNDDRYFDVFVEYAKAGPEDILIRITRAQPRTGSGRATCAADLWFRNTWSLGRGATRSLNCASRRPSVIAASHHELGEYWLACDGAPELLFTENESNAGRLWGPDPTRRPM